MILVTGGAGFIGSHLAEALAKTDSVRVLDNLSAGSQNIPLLKKQKIDAVTADIRDADAASRAAKDCTAVFHLAAMNRAQRSIDNPLEANAVNVDGTLNVLDACRKNDAHVVFVSSSSVYGGTGGHEDQPLHPLHPYGVGKMAGEAYTRVFHELYGVPAVILRYVSVFGPRQRGDLDHAAVIPKFVEKIQTGKPVTIFGDGSQTRQFTYVQDTVDGTLAAWQKAKNAEVFNIASAEETSVMQIVKLIEKKTGKKAVLEKKNRSGADPLRNFIDVSKAKKVLGFAAKTPFEKGLEKTLAAMGSN